MVSRQSIGSRYSDTWLVFLGMAAAVAVGFVTHIVQQPVPTATGLGMAAAVVLAFLARWWAVARGRRWLSAAAGGFVLDDRHASRFVAEADVVSLATKTTVRYGGGVPAGTVHRGEIGLRDGRVPFRYEYALDQVDPLGYFFDHLLKRLTKRAAADLAKGDAVRGDGWELSPAGLRYAGRRGDGVLAADDIAAADVVDGHVCVWGQGDLHPAVRVPAGSANALVLLADLRSFVDATAPDDAELAGGLGRVLFERGRAANVRAVLVVTGLFVGAAAGVGGLGGGWKGAGIGAAVVAVVASPLMLVALLTAGDVFRCHARGVVRRSLWRTRELRYADVGAFTYEATRNYYHGVYTGTNVRLRFAPRRDVGGRAVAFADSVKNGDAELDALREHVGRVVAERMLADLRDGEWVPWTRGLEFTRDGLELHAPGGLFRRAATRLIPYAEIAAAHVEAGHFFLFMHGTQKAAYTTPVSAANFFPGLALLELVRYQPVAARGELAAAGV